jgi:predicted GIY-YIG superfamily endonuclease/DNA-directed RNA polymerase subunit RPC12/RpoP
MSRKRWHFYIMRERSGRFSTGVTNEPDRIDGVAHLECCRDRTAAIKREDQVRRLARRKHRTLIEAAVMSMCEDGELPDKLYRVVNEGFVCINCGASVEPTRHDAPRNHCPFCLHSRHVDVQPGDRKNPCGGLLVPVGVETSGSKGYVILYRCERCGETTRAKAALKTPVQPDDFDKIVELSRGK